VIGVDPAIPTPPSHPDDEFPEVAQRAEPDPSTEHSEGQPDTAAIRADLQRDRGCLKFDPFHRIIDLCDALDAARRRIAELEAGRE
jgi:hypothetical protein